MTRRISKRFFLTSALSALAGTALARPPERSLRPVMRSGSVAGTAAPRVASAEALIRSAELGGDVSYAVADAKTGLILESGGDRLGLPPASTTKAVTALYALDTLGAGHRFHTELVAGGQISGGVLKGDLILKGGGDPTLDTDRLAKLAAELKAAGVREVRGRFIVDGSALPFIRQIDRAQPDHVSYNPAISGLNLNFNRVHFEWKRQGGKWRVAMDARSRKYRTEVSFARMQIAARETPVYTYSERGGKDRWTVASAALGNGGARWLPVRQPEIYAGEVFRTFARAQGIVLDAPRKGRGGGRVIVRQQSADLRTICHDFLKYSNNMMAEAIGLAASAARAGKPRSLKASGAEMSRFAARKLGMNDSAFVDHSGLGDDSRATARDMALAMVRARAAIAPLLKPFPMRDERRRVIKGHPITVHAKTGTLNFVSALSGFATGEDGTDMAFAIIAANMDVRSKITRANRERPRGGRSWNRRAKALQQKLIERWGALYAS